jgi:hypothetical protein
MIRSELLQRVAEQNRHLYHLARPSRMRTSEAIGSSGTPCTRRRKISPSRKGRFKSSLPITQSTPLR